VADSKINATELELTLEWVGEVRPEGPRAGVGFLGRGSQPLSTR